MPPKKAAAASAAPESTTPQDPVNGISAFDLPRSQVTRLMKAAMPAGGKTTKDIAPIVQRATTVFISYLTAAAQENAAANNQKTLSGQHVLDAIRLLPWSEANELEKDMQEELAYFRNRSKTKKAGGNTKTAPSSKPAPKAKAADSAPPKKKAPAADAAMLDVDEVPNGTTETALEDEDQLLGGEEEEEVGDEEEEDIEEDDDEDIEEEPDDIGTQDIETVDLPGTQMDEDDDS